ncbi:hypothetical protein ACFTWF_38445 [Rhodococcus sp. NPDC056960]|uniref:hypothetical protein n=1 Tax=Rhodococcus sp. NPDC056960 TaxID=3345982 RepID=UPI003638434A
MRSLACGEFRRIWNGADLWCRSLGLTPVLVPVWKGSTDAGIGVWADSSIQGTEPTPLANATTDFDIETIAAPI